MKPEPADATSALEEIDTSSLASLEVVRGEEAAVRQLVQKAVEKKESVSPGVFSRVMGDYEERLRAFDERANPLREHARRELGKLEVVHGRLKSLLDAAVLAQQEIEFRHELGELKDQEFEERGQKAKLEVANSQGAFDRAEALRQRFLDLLPPPSEPAPTSAKAADNPKAADKKPSAPVSRPSASPETGTATGSSTGSSAGMGTGSRKRPGPAGPPPTAPPEAGKKPAAPASASAGPATLFVPPPAVADSPPEVDEYRTVNVVQPGRLVEDRDGVSGATHPLGILVTIGRTPDNHVAIATPDVSRRHARIEHRPDGSFLVTDLRSGNGTFVNGERIKERVLEDGDKVRFGNRSFVFYRQI
jgi:hypothetical protein